MTKDLEFYIKNELEMYCTLKNTKQIASNIPSNIYIEPTNACNLECDMCARGKMNRKIGYITLEDFKVIIDKMENDNFFAPLTLTGNGEPMLHKDIFSMIKYSKKKRFNVSMISNSTVLKDSNIEKVISSGLDRYQTMFDSITKESFEKIRLNADYEKTKQKIIKLIEKNEEAGHPLFISIGLVKTSINNDVDETVSYWESFPIDNFYISPLFTLQADSGLYEQGINSVSREVYKVCVNPWTDLFISYDGDVRLCPQDFNNSYIIGNLLKEDSIMDIWNGENAQKLRKSLLENDLEYFTKIGHDCAKCNTPYVLYSIDDYQDSIPSRIIRKIKTFIK